MKTPTCPALPATVYALGYARLYTATCQRQLRVLHRCEVAQ